MKNLKLLCVIAFCVFVQQVNAQNCCNVPARKKDTSFVLPKLIDTGLFISDIRNKLDFKSVFDKFKRSKFYETYMYTFAINQLGELQPSLYYDKESVDMKKIQQFVETGFNNYRWEAGYKKKCETCKAKIYLQLIIYFHTDVNTVEVDIEDIETIKKIFHLVIPYRDLKNFAGSGAD